MKTYLIFLLLLIGTVTVAFAADDELAKDIKNWKEFVRTNTATDETSKYVRESAEPLLIRAEQALADGKRLYALHVIGAIRGNLYSVKYINELPSKTRREFAAFEEEWKKIGAQLSPVLAGKEKPDFNGLSDATRAIAEAAFSEVKVYYESSLDYGRDTDPDSGLFYLGLAQGQLDLARFCSGLKDAQQSKPHSGDQIADEVDEFEKFLLSLYKPPASVEQHPIFIRSSAMIKQAHELLASNMNDGALYRYLDARRRLSPIIGAGSTITAADATKRAKDFEKRLAKSSEDNSIAQLFVEMALVEASDTTPNSKGGETANVIFNDVLPHYFKAIEPQKAKRVVPKPEITVTLVRWPYT
jgi:hypothetical protein